MKEHTARTGLKFGYPDGYYRHLYPDLYNMPRSATAALDMENNRGEHSTGTPKVINKTSFKEWVARKYEFF